MRLTFKENCSDIRNSKVADADCLLVAIAHKQFADLTLAQMDKFFVKVPNNEKVLIDVKKLYSREDLEKTGSIGSGSCKTK